MIGLMLKISGAWLFSILAGLPLYVSMGLAALAFLWWGGMPITVLPQNDPPATQEDFFTTAFNTPMALARGHRKARNTPMQKRRVRPCVMKFAAMVRRRPK